METDPNSALPSRAGTLPTSDEWLRYSRSADAGSVRAARQAGIDTRQAPGK